MDVRFLFLAIKPGRPHLLASLMIGGLAMHDEKILQIGLAIETAI